MTSHDTTPHGEQDPASSRATTGLAALRTDYDRDVLVESVAAADPYVQFEQWLADALDAPAVAEATAMVLATVGEDGWPSSRTVLLKGVEQGRFVFFTHTTSAKGRDLAHEPRCALLFEWHGIQRQVRIRGRATPLEQEAVQHYFDSRPRSARLGAWASRQSEPIASRSVLDAGVAEATTRFGALESDGPVPVPPTWGGYGVEPSSFEFWQGRPSRLHDRLRWDRAADGTWARTRLAP